IVAAITTGFELNSKTNAVLFQRIIDIVIELELELISSTSALRTTAIESARHQNSLARRRGSGLGVEPASLEAHLVVVALSNHSGISQPEKIFRLILRERPRGEIKVAGAEIVLEGGIALVLKSRRVRLVESMLDSGIDIQPARRTKRQISERSSGQRSHNCFCVEEQRTISVQEEGGVVLPKRAVERQSKTTLLFGASKSSESLTSVQSFVAKAKIK